MIEPDLRDRETCCGAPTGHHWEDCPGNTERLERQRLEDEQRRVREGHALMVVSCKCSVCAIGTHL